MTRSHVVALALLALAPQAWAQAPVVAPFSQARAGGPPPPGWSVLTFPRIERHSRYELVDDDGAVVVAATAERSASGWIHRLDIPVAQARILRWRWKAERLPANGDSRTKAGDDAAARVYVTFRYSPDRLPWHQRLLYETGRTLYGEAPPHASLMYVWDTRVPAGTSLANPYTERVRTIVVESGAARLGQWVEVERDLVADYRAAFGDEPPPLSGVAIMTDADNTGGSAAAKYGDITLAPR
ncbi:MAG TPA: DUF3047 domain-containing protein [Casimicrobiaceae bacterium]|nr:DUF3047 domain-containing protein [Casimicrobiaceae bacterium]